MKLLIDTKEELQDSDTAQVVFGAPFRAYLYGDVGVPGDYLLLGKMKNNTYKDANDITYTWKEGHGWPN